MTIYEVIDRVQTLIEWAEEVIDLEDEFDVRELLDRIHELRAVVENAL